MEIDAQRLLSEERHRLVRFCDQMTLLEAWRLRDRLQDPTRERQWLFGIARNMCLRWLRAQQRRKAREWLQFQLEDDEMGALEEQLVDAFDMEQELERKEFLHLLDQALALLSPATRTVLIERYVQDLPIHEIAQQQSISVAAATKRLQRSKEAFRHILTTQLREELRPYLIVPNMFTWHDVRLWCPYCGDGHLKAASPPQSLHFTCSHCSPDPTRAMFIQYGSPGCQQLCPRPDAAADVYQSTVSTAVSCREIYAVLVL